MIAVENEKKFGFFQLSELSTTPKMVVNETEMIYANKACLRLLKIENISEIGKQQLQRFIHPNVYDASQKRLDQILKEKSTFEQMELKLIDRHNQPIDAELTIGPFYFEKELFAQIILQDLTEKLKFRTR
ncbi:PAS domain-containing protein [Neobacillus sp. SM06]|uniref:PAS domain-containing protein n=1 Tax=Neobacillus sp. SM06 TaxID=3422492 RepID=UPI003D29FB82